MFQSFNGWFKPEKILLCFLKIQERWSSNFCRKAQCDLCIYNLALSIFIYIDDNIVKDMCFEERKNSLDSRLCIKTAMIRKSQWHNVIHLERMLMDREDGLGNFHSDVWSYCKGGSRRFIGTNTLNFLPHILIRALESLWSYWYDSDQSVL